MNIFLKIVIKDFGGFDLCFQTIIFSFQTIFHIYSHTFLPTRIFINIFKQQFLVFKHMYQTDHSCLGSV